MMPRESTIQWLMPLLDAADREGIETIDLMTQSTMPVREAYLPPEMSLIARLREQSEMEMPDPLRALDWIRFGQLVRERLGWEDYPSEPPPPTGEAVGS